MRRFDLTGRIVGRLTVLSYSHTGKDGHSRWLCQCKCGNQIVVGYSNLKGGNTSSCGCLRKEVAKVTNSKHGDSRVGKRKRLYCIWMGIRSRCNNPQSKDYDLYGSRGITVCELWNIYENFRNWALANGYNDSLSIDRIDSNFGYSPDNCRWVDNSTQANNKRNNLVITAFGKTQTAAEWGRTLGIKATTIRLRLHRGCSPSEALSKVNKRIGKAIK